MPGPPAGPLEVPLPALLRAARDGDARATATGAMPARLNLGRDIGPNLFLQAARAALTALSAGTPPAMVPLARPVSPAPEPVPVGEETALAQRPAFRNMRFRNGWVIFPPDFEGQNVIELTRLQTWTGKPAA